MGRGAAKSADILFGDNPRLANITQVGKPWQYMSIQLSADEAGPWRQWFENRQGWSGSAAWMVRASMLPEEWATGLTDEESMSAATFKLSLEREVISEIESEEEIPEQTIANSIECDLKTLLMSNGEANLSRLIIEPQHTIKSFEAPTHFLQAVERALGSSRGKWMLHEFSAEQGYHLVYVLSHRIRGIVWTGKVA